MANIKLRKAKILSSDITGFHITRFERLEKAYGTILATDVADNDIVIFAELPARDIIRATFVSGANSKSVRYGTDFTTAIPFTIDGVNDIQFEIDYIRGSNTAAKTLKLDITE